MVALAAPNPAEQSPYHCSLFPIKMSAKSQESHRAESLAGLDHSRGLVHRQAQWARGTDKDGHDTPETRMYTLSLSHTPSLVWVYQPQGLEYIFRFYSRDLRSSRLIAALWKHTKTQEGADYIDNLQRHIREPHQETSFNGSLAHKHDHDRW